MTISVLGRVRLRGQEIPSARQRRLVAALVLHRGSDVSSGRLAEYIWGEQQPADPSAALHTLVSRVRTMLPDTAIIESLRGSYRLVAPTGVIDIDRVLHWRAAIAELNTSEQPAAIDEFLALYTGEPFVDIDDIDAIAAREQALELRVGLLEARAESAILAGNVDAAIITLREVLIERPDRESSAALLMETLYRRGRQPEALAVYATLRDHLLNEFGVDPTPRLSELEVAILRHHLTPTAPPSDAPRSIRRATMPHRASSFVGRGHDVDGLAALLTRVRFVTVLGPGGIGKTSLASEVATKVEGVGTRVVVAELADLAEGTDLAAAVAGRIEAPTQATESPRDALAHHLASAPTLLYLDNCEHLLESVADLIATLLGASPTLRILATSREPIGAEGEHRWVIHGLPIADAEQLFVDRAGAARAEAESLRGDARVRLLCERLDGVPLALELAARALAYMSLDEIISGLDNRFELLNRNRRSAPDRHQSLEATLDWSYQRLQPFEQQAFDRLGVFAGSFSAADARQLVGPHAADVIATLVDRSLVGVDPLATPARYELLDTMRAYARRNRGDQLDIDRAALAHFVLDYAITASAHTSGPDESKWFNDLRTSMANLRQAYQYFVETRNDNHRVRLVAALAMWAWQCDQAEVLAWALETALDVSVTDPELAAYVFAAATITRSRSNELFEGADTAQRAAIVTQSTGGVAAALSFYAAAEVGLFRGEFSSAEQSALRAYSFGAAAGDAPGARAATFFAAIDAALAIIYSGRSAEAGIWIDTAHRLAIELDSAGARAWVEFTQADAAFSGGDIDRALEHMNRCVALIDGSQHSFLAGVADLSLAALASAQNGLKPGTVRRDLLLSVFERWQTTMSWAQATLGLRLLAAALAAEGQSLNAAVILGAFFASAVDPSGARVQTAETLSRLSADLSDGELQRLLAQGGAMSLHDAVQHAIEILTDSLPN